MNSHIYDLLAILVGFDNNTCRPPNCIILVDIHFISKVEIHNEIRFFQVTDPPNVDTSHARNRSSKNYNNTTIMQLVLVIITKNSVFRGHNATNRSQRYENRRDIKTRELVPQAD